MEVFNVTCHWGSLTLLQIAVQWTTELCDTVTQPEQHLKHIWVLCLPSGETVKNDQRRVREREVEIEIFWVRLKSRSMWTFVPKCGTDAAFTDARTCPLPVQAWLFLHSQMSNNHTTVWNTWLSYCELITFILIAFRQKVCSKNHYCCFHGSCGSLSRNTPKAIEKSVIPEINYSLLWFQYLKIDSHDCKAVCYV